MTKRAIYYYTSWSTYARNFQVKDIPDEVTDICYAFFNLDSNGNVFSGDSWADTDKRFTGIDSVDPPDTWNESNTTFYGNFGQIKKLQELRRRSGKAELNVQLSVGGWTWSKFFSDAVCTDSKRSIFVNSLISIFKKFPIFNGVSIDWEFPSNNGVNYGNEGNIVRREDSINLTIFLKKLREAFAQNGMANFNIALCCTAAPEKANFDVERIHPLIDELHIMSYDFSDGNWGDRIASHHTNPRKSKFQSKPGYSCEEAADFYIGKGVPSEKLFIGAAFYSRGFGNCDGLGKAASGGSPDISFEKGIVNYTELPKEGAKEFVDKESMACFSYDPVKRVLNSYDNPASVKEKCKIVYEKNLGGIIVWELSGDRNPVSGNRSLVKTLAEGLSIIGNNEPVRPPTVPMAPTVPPTLPTAPPTVPTAPNASECLCKKLKSIKVTFQINVDDQSLSNVSVNLEK